MVNNKHTSLDCPNCHRTDSVQKVTSILRSGTSEGRINGQNVSGFYNFGDNSISLGGGKVSGSISISSNLIDSLAPPELEKAPNQGCLMLSFMASFIVAFFFLIAAFAGPIYLIGCLIFGVIGAILVFIYKKRDDDYQKFLRERKPKYEKALERWNNLYYCHRCDGIFVPGKNISTVENMINYLYTVK